MACPHPLPAPAARTRTLVLHRALSSATGPALTEYLPNLLVPLSGRMLKAKWRDSVTSALQTLEQNGGPDAGAAIKKKIPTYTSIFF